MKTRRQGHSIESVIRSEEEGVVNMTPCTSSRSWVRTWQAVCRLPYPRVGVTCSRPLATPTMHPTTFWPAVPDIELDEEYEGEE